MKTIICMAAFMLPALLIGQEGEEKITVRIKKVEDVNGVKKTTDTSFTVDKAGWEARRLNTEDVGAPGKNIRVIEIGDTGEDRILIDPADEKEGSITIRQEPGSAQREIRIVKKGKDGVPDTMVIKAGSDMPQQEGKAVARFVHVNTEASEVNGVKTCSVTIIRKITITEPGDDELSRAGAERTSPHLEIRRLDLYPNPANGKFRLSFQLSEKGDTRIEIRSADGKNVYEEHLGEFSGRYDRDINLGGNPAGIYLITVKQGKSTIVKKAVLE